MENNELKNRITITLNAMLQGKRLTHEELFETAKSVAKIITPGENYDDAFYEDVVLLYEVEFGGKTFDQGIMLANKKTTNIWLQKKKSTMKDDDHQYENRYRRYLQTCNFQDQAIDNIFGASEKILSKCADPESTEGRKGLVIGDVQSGKTSNYLALANMACDYGYKVIIILAGITDSLRIQTQKRVDEGIVGAISSTIRTEDIKYIGVGRKEQSYYAIPLTNDIKDFSPSDATSNDYNKPLILVIKKNKKVLQAVDKWLKPGQNNISSRNILIIDDECDNASVNTGKEDKPTAINKLIRKIYNNFTCATYVGFTATPFANIFINSNDEEGNEDLFPSDFIYRLHASDDLYYGANKVFQSDENGDYRYIKKLDENEENFLTIPHKKDFIYKGLAESLKDAICNFLIVNCIRTHRGYGKKHRTMMINITPYNILQSDIEYYVSLYVKKLKNTIWQYDHYSLDKFLKDKEMKRIYDIYTKDKFFNNISSYKENCKINEEMTFDELKESLYSEVSKFVIKVINNNNKDRFSYDDYKDSGARLIAIGGYVLSRGLTLEGLMTSYLSRSTIAYDTLLQMARWFGYRPHYEDLCRIYMSDIYIDCFKAVIDSVSNLDEQISVMNAQGKTPKDFGLMIKESPDTLETNLIITQRAKMKNSRAMKLRLNYSGIDIDTSKIFKDPEANNHNMKAYRDLYDTLVKNDYKLVKNEKNRYMFLDVPPIFISNFIKSLIIPLENKKFDKENISEFILEASEKYYSKWDIVIATGEDNDNCFKANDEYDNLPSVKRKFAMRKNEDIIRISGKNNRVLDPGIFNSGLSDKQKEQAELLASKRAKNKGVIAKDYLSVDDRKPLLVLMPLSLSYQNDQSSEASSGLEAEEIINNYHGLVLAVGIGFAGKTDGAYINYRLNKIKEEEYYNYDLDAEEVDEDNE